MRNTARKYKDILIFWAVVVILAAAAVAYCLLTT